jgi:hypothetical protein
MIKKILTMTVVCAMIAITTAFAAFKNGKVVLMVEVEVPNFTEWKTKFDAGASVREKAGIKVISICTSVENPNHVLVVEEAENAQAAHDFVTVLKSRQKAGDVSKMNIKMYDKAE